MKKKKVVLLAIITILVLGGYRNYLENQLFDAIKNTDIEKAKRALKMGADIDCTEHWKYAIPYWYNRTPLTLACDVGSQEMVELLIENGADINKEEPRSGYSPLASALNSDNSQERYKLAWYLIENGADIYYCAPLSTPLEESIVILDSDEEETIRRGYELFEYLMERDVSTEMTTWPYKLLGYAANFNNVPVITYLLENECSDINETAQPYNQTALMIAAEKGNKEACLILLENGADYMIKSEEGKTAYDYAYENGFEEIAEKLKTN